MTSFEQALKHKPDSAEVYYRLGMVQFQKRNNIASAQMLLKALNIDPSHADAWMLFGSVCLLEGANLDAIRAFEKCAESASGVQPVPGSARGRIPGG